MKTTILFFFTCITIIANSQSTQENITTEWQRQKSLGGTSDDFAYSIQQTKDGGYIVAGRSSSNDGDVSGHHGFFYRFDYWIVKLDDSGNIQWQKSLGGTFDDVAYSIDQTKDGGYIVAGKSSSNDGDVSGHHGDYGDYGFSDYWIVKLDSTGNIQWQRSLGGTSEDYATSIEQTKDEGYIVAGFSYSNNGNVSGNHGDYDYWVVKLDKKGKIQWQKCLGGTYADKAYYVQQTKDGGYIVAGYSGSNDGDISGNHGDYDYWIVKLDSAGNIQWQKSLGGTSGDLANSIHQTKDGGYIVAGSSLSNDGDVSGHHGDYGSFDYWIVKLDIAGNIQWEQSLGGNNLDEANSIQQTKDGGYIVAGLSLSNDGDVSGNHGSDDYWIVKLDSAGNIQGQQSLGGTSYDVACSIEQTKNGGYIVAGCSTSNDGNVSGNHGSEDYWIVKLKPLKTLDTQESYGTTNSNALTQKQATTSTLHIQPNPSHNATFTADFGAIKNNLLITVTDNSGKQVYAKQLSSAQQFTIQLNNKPKGIYYLHVSFDGGEETKKLVVE